MKLAHLSDLHFGSHVASVVDDLLDDLHELSPEHVVVTGDLTQRARKREFRMAAEFLVHLPGEVSVIPGNHDIPAFNPWLRFMRPYSRYRRYVRADISASFSSPRISVLGLNSTRRASLNWNWATGAIKRQQLEQVAAWAETAEVSSIKVLALHHPVVGFGRGSFSAVNGYRDLIATAANTKVDLILTGHAHRVNVMRILHEGHGLITAGASTATSNRLRGEPNAYLVVDISDEAMLLSERVHAASGFRRGRQWRFDLDTRDLMPVRR